MEIAEQLKKEAKRLQILADLSGDLERANLFGQAGRTREFLLADLKAGSKP